MNSKKSMDRYENLGTVGEGSYGVVTKCKDKTNGLIVAIKKFLESDTDKAVKKIASREIKILKSLRHENLVNLIEVFRRNKRIYLVFEFIEHNLLEEIEKTSNGLGESKTKEIMYQVCRGLDFMHSNNFIHRDLKPENILINKNGLIKLCDFGFARPIASASEAYTDYVATRWYRSPELLVGDPKYGKPVDVWSLGTLAYEVLTSKPLFPGESDLDQLYLIINSLGDLPDSMKICFQNNHFYMNAKFPRMKNFNPLQNKLKKYSNNLVKFIIDALVVDPSKRSTSSDLLHHELFSHNNWLDDFSGKLKNIISIYESTVSKSLAKKNQAKKASDAQIEKMKRQKQIDKQNEINRIKEMNKQLEIQKLKEISQFIIQNETAAPHQQQISSTNIQKHSNSNLSYKDNIINDNDIYSHKQKTSSSTDNLVNTTTTTTTSMSNINVSRNSYNNLNNLNTNTRLPKIESVHEHDSESALKSNNKPTSPTHVSLNTTSNLKNSTDNKVNGKYHSNSIDYGQVIAENLKSNSILSINTSIHNSNKNELASNSLTNTNRLHALNSNSNTYFGSHNNVFILEETYKLNNGSELSTNGFYKNHNLKRQNELKQSNSKIESSLNLPQVKQIELYSKAGKNSVYEKNPFLMPINKK